MMKNQTPEKAWQIKIRTGQEEAWAVYRLWETRCSVCVDCEQDEVEGATMSPGRAPVPLQARRPRSELAKCEQRAPYER